MPEPKTLVRSLGRASLVALVVNGTIGTGVFILPGTAAARLGWWAPVAWIVAGILTGLVVLSAAEVASRYQDAGGPYLYAQEAFGRFMGLQMAWIGYLVRVLGAAVQANLLTAYLAEFWVGAASPAGRAISSALLLGVLAAINIRGVTGGARTTILFALVKFSVLLLFGIAGVAVLLRGGTPAGLVGSDLSASGWLQAVLLLMFAYGGFESAILPASWRAPSEPPCSRRPRWSRSTAGWPETFSTCRGSRWPWPTGVTCPRYSDGCIRCSGPRGFPS